MKKNELHQTLVGRVAENLAPDTGSSNLKEQRVRPLLIEALEPRVLFSGAPAPSPAPEPAPTAQEAPAPAESAPEADAPAADANVAVPPAATNDQVGTEAEVAAPENQGVNAVTLTDSEVAAVAEAAAQRWVESGITIEQQAALAAASYQVADLAAVGANVIGATEGNIITIDDDAAGSGWFIDQTPQDNGEFELDASGSLNSPAGGIDLLSVILHEQGHLLGLDDSGVTEGDVMFEVFIEGERRLPDPGQAHGAIAGSLDGVHFATNSTGGSDSWNVPTNWDTGSVPTGTDDAVVNADLGADTTPPTYSGGLTINGGNSLTIFGSDAVNALGTGDITMNTGSELLLRTNNGSTLTFNQQIHVTGDATIWGGRSTAGHHTTRNFNGVIDGAGELTLDGVNNNTFHLNNANTMDGFVAQSTQNQGFRVEANVAGSLGAGDVTINNNATLQVDAADAIGDSGILSLNGSQDSRRTAKLIMNANDEVGGFFIDGVDQGTGDFSSATHPGIIGGTGILTVPVPNVPDFDGDTYNAGANPATDDLNDGDNTIYPGAPELPDLKDNNQDGTVDDGLTPVNRMVSDGGGNISWLLGSNWQIEGNTSFNHMPGVNDSAIVSAGLTAQVTSLPSGFDYAGTLTLETGSTLVINNTGGDTNLDALGGAGIIMQDGTTINTATASDPHFAPIELAGGNATFSNGSNAADHDSRFFDGAITGAGSMTIVGRNNNTYHFNAAGDFSGGLIANGGGYRIEANVSGSLGTGDVTINTGVTLQIDATETIGDDATLNLNGGKDGRRASKLILNSDETVAGFFVDGVDQGTGTFGATGSGADTIITDTTLFTGSGILTVAAAVSETTTVTLDGADLAITDSDGTIANQFEISRTGSTVTIRDASGNTISTGGLGTGDGTDTVVIPLTAWTGGIVVNSEGGDDSLTVDLTTALGRALEFNGGTDDGGGDELEVSGTSVTDLTVTHTGKDSQGLGTGFDGNLDLDGSVITFTGLEPVLINVGTVANAIFNLPASNDVATLVDNGATLTLDAPTFESTTFTKPTGSLTINGGGGTDSLDLGAISYGGTLVLDLEAVTQSGVYSGAGSIVKNGSGTMALSQANTLGGDITIAGGTATVTNASGLGSTAGDTIVAGGATLTIDLAGSQTVAENLIFNSDGTGRASLRVDNPAGQVTTLSGDIEVNSTGANLVQFFSQGGSGGTIRYTGDVSGDLNNSLWFLRSNRNHEVLGSVNLINGGDLAITDGARVEIGAAGETYDWDNTNVAFGTLVTNIDNLLPATTNLNLGQSNGSPAGDIDLNGTDQTVNNLSATSNNADPNMVTIDTGNTLTVNGNFYVGRTGNNQTTNLTATGGGALEVNGSQVRIGEDNNSQNSTENRVTVDLTGLGSFTTDVSEFLVGSRDPGSQDGSRIRANLLLSDTANTITSDLILVDDSGNQNTSPATMTLGAGTNAINADDIRIGLGKGNGRVEFGGAAGTVTIRGAAGGSSAANIVVGQNTVVNTGATTTGLLDLDGHDADIIANTVTIANRTRSGNGVSGTFNVGSAGTTVSINTLIIADRTNGGTATGTYTQSGGTLSVGTGTQNLIIGRNNSTAGLSEGTMDVSGASSVTIDVANVNVGLGGNTNAAFGYGDLILSDTGTNTVTATTVTVGDSTNTGNTGDTSTLQLGGATNTFNVDDLTIGARKSLGSLTIDAGGTFTLNGSGGAGTRADLSVGDNNVGTGTNGVGTVDLSGGTFNGMLDQVVIGRHATSGGSGTGTFTMDAGDFDANSVVVGDGRRGIGTLTVNGGDVTIGSGAAAHDFIVGRNLINQSTATAQQAVGTVDFSGATSFTADVDDFFIGVKGNNSNGKATGVVTLATDNDITANEIKVGRSGNNGGFGNELHFGSGTNDVTTPVFTVGEFKTQGATVDVAAGGTVNLGDSANRVELTIGLKNANTGATTAGTVDFSAGTANIFATNINIAQESNTGGSGSPVGTLILGDGSLDVTGDVSEGTPTNGQGASSLTVVGDQDFTIGGTIDVDTFTIGLDGSAGNVTYTGGPANIGDGNGTLDIARSNVAGQSNTSSLDLSAATAVTIDVTQVRIGTLPGAANPGSNAVGTLTLSTAGANSVTAGTVILGDSPGSGNTSGTSTIELGGATNTFAVNQLTIGNRKSAGAITSDAGGSFTLTGTGGAGTGTLDIARRTVNTGANGSGLLDLSDASSVDINVNTIRVGTITSGGSGGNSVGTWNFSDTGTNVVTANSILLADSSAVGNTNGAPSTINLGQDNTINVNTFDVGGRKSRGVVDIDAGGTLTLQGQGGAGTEADLLVGNNFANNTGTNNDGVFDMTGGTLNATLDQLTVGRYVGTTGSGSGNGEFTMDAGYVTANSILLASSAGSNAANTDGVINLNGGILDLQDGIIDDGGGTAVFNFNDATLRDVDVFGFNLDQDNGTGLLQIGPDMTIDDMTVNGDYTGAAGGILEIGLDGEAGAGVAGGHDQLIVNGVVTLNDLTLDLNTAAALTITPGSTFVLIDNDGTDAVVGEFVGLAEGTIVSLAIPNPGTPPPAEVPGNLFQISYTGGTGNDVVLTGLGVSATTNIWLDIAGNLHIEDIDGADSEDNLTIRVEGTEVVVIDPDNALGTLIVGATQTAVGEVRVDTSLFGGDVIVETRGGDDVINLGSLGDSGGAPGGVIPGNLIVDGGDDFDAVKVLAGSSSILTTDSNIDIDAETFKADLGSSVSVTGTGGIDIDATGGGAEDFIGLQLKRATLTSEGGDITLDGEGGSVGKNNDGVLLSHGSTVTATDGGSVTITGTGTSAAGSNDGVSLLGGSDITVSGAGAIALTGESSGVSDSYGVQLFRGTTLASEDGDITLAGTSVSTGARNSGIYTNTATVTTAGAGSIALDGEGSGGGSHNKGLRLAATELTAAGTGGITLTGTGGQGTSSNVGVQVGVRTTLATDSGDVTITGEGTGSTSKNAGVAFLSKSSVGSGGDLTVTGTAGDGTSHNDGVSLTSASLSATGDLTVTGEGNGSRSYNRGIDSTNSTFGGAGVTLAGTGSTGSASGRFNDGVYLNRGGATAAGTLTIDATGGTGSSDNRGFYASRVDLAGTLAITGTADATTTGVRNTGVFIQNSTLAAGSITGTAGGGTGSFGAYMQNILGGLTSTSVTTSPLNDETERKGNFFPAILPLLMAEVDRRNHRRKSEEKDSENSLRGLFARIHDLGGLQEFGEGETPVFRSIDGQIALDPIAVIDPQLADLHGFEGMYHPANSQDERSLLVLTGDDDERLSGFVVAVDERGELLSSAPLPALGDLTVGEFEEMLKDAESSSPRWSADQAKVSQAPLAASSSFLELAGIE